MYIQVAGANAETCTHLRETRKGTLEVLVPIGSRGLDEKIELNEGLWEATFQRKTANMGCPCILTITQPKSTNDRSKVYTKNILQLLCSVKENNTSHVVISKCKVVNQSDIRIAADRINVPHNITSDGCLTLAAEKDVRIQALVKSPYVALMSKNGVVHISSEGTLLTEELTTSAKVKTTVLGRVCYRPKSHSTRKDDCLVLKPESICAVHTDIKVDAWESKIVGDLDATHYQRSNPPYLDAVWTATCQENGELDGVEATAHQNNTETERTNDIELIADSRTNGDRNKPVKSSYAIQKTNKNEQSLVRVTINGDLHIGTHGTIGTDTRPRHTFSTDTLELEVTHNIYNYGLIGANRLVRIRAGSIRSGREYEDETVQRYFSVIQKNRAGTAELDGVLEPATANDLHMAISRSDVEGVAALLSKGVDPNVALTGKTASELADEKLTPLFTTNHDWSEDRDRINDVASLIRSDAKRSGRIIAPSIVCNSMENVDDCSQLFGAHVELDAAGDLVVEEHSIWTSRIIVAKCGGSFIVRGTVKCEEIQSFEIGTNLLLEKGSKVFVGKGAHISVANIFHNESILYNRRGLLNISTNVLRQNEDCKLGSCEKLRLEITRDSNNIHGSVEADVLFLCIAASVETHCEFISKQVCAVTITQNVAGNTCGRLTLQGPLEVQNGAFVAMNRKVKEYAGDDADIVVRSTLVCRGIDAGSVGFCVHSSSVIEILPVTGPTSTNEDREVNLSCRYLLTKAGSSIKFVVDSRTRRIFVDSTDEWIHNGCMVVIKETDNMAIQTYCKVCKFIHRGELNNFDNIMFLIRDKLTNLRTISVKDSIWMFGNGRLINEHGGMIQCDNGKIEIEGLCSIENKNGANILGGCISITTRSGKKELAEIQLIAEKTFDVSNKGVVKSQQDLIINAGNIDNLGGVIESVFSPVQMGWSTRCKVTTIEGHVLTPELAVFTAYNSESFLLRCVGGQSSCENANVFDVPAAGIVAECLRGTIVVDTCICGYSVCTVVARRGCSIMKSVEVPTFNVIPCHATTTELHKALDGDVREYTDDVDLGEDILQLRLPVTTYNEPWHDRKSFLLNITNPITLIVDEINFKSSSPQSQIIMRTNNGQIVCKNLLFADNCLVIDGDIELSPICKVTAEALVCSPKSKCSIWSIDGPGEDMLNVFVIADQYVRLHGLITGATNQQQTVHIYCQEGVVQNSGTIELANLIVAASATSSMQLSGEINISGMLWLAAATDILLLDNCDIHCTTFACKPFTGDNTSKQSNLSINSGCLHIAGTTHCKIETFSVCPDGSINVCTDQCQDVFIIEVNKTASISGRLECRMEGLFHLECNDTLSLINLRATIRSQNCTLMAVKSVHIDRGSEINVISGTLTITTAAENQKEINGNVTVLGQIKGSVVNETDAGLSCDASYCVLDIQACDARFEGSLIQGFDRTDLFAAIQLFVDTNSMLTGGTKLEIDCKTFEHQGVIDQYKVVDIKVWNTLIVGRIQNCVEIKLLSEMATVNNGEISGKRTAIVSPVYLNCPSVTGDKPIACGRAVPCLGTDGQQELIVEGLLCIVVGSHLQSRNINIKSVMRFDFAAKTSTVPSRDDLKNWKSVSDSHLSKLANGTADTDVGTLVQEAVHLPKVICNLGVASRLCNDIVATSMKIQSTGLAAFNVNDLTSCLNKAHTQYSSISSLNIKLNISKKFRKIKTATKHMARELMEKLLPASFSSSQIFRTNDGTEAIEEGIETSSFVYTGESTEVKSAANITAMSLKFNNQKGIWKNEGHVEACGDIMVSAKEISQVGKNGNVMRALHGAITLLGQYITAKGLVSMDLTVGGNGKVDVQNAVVSDGTQIVGDTVIGKDLRSKNLMVEGKGDVAMEDTAVADSTYIKGDKVTAKHVHSKNLMVEGKGNVDVEDTNVTGDTQIMGDKVTAKHIKSSNLMVAGKGNVTMEDTDVANSTQIKGDKVTATHLKSTNLMVEGKGDVDVEDTAVTEHTQIHCKGNVVVTSLTSQSATIEGSKSVSLQTSKVGVANITAKENITVDDIDSNTLYMETDSNINIGKANVIKDLSAKSNGGNVQFDAKVKAKNAYLEAKHGDIDLLGRGGKAKHEFGSVQITTNCFNDIYSLLDKSGAYEDIKISERLGLAVDDQQVVLSHLRKQEHSVSIEAASIDVATDFTSEKNIHLNSASGLRVHSGAHVEAGNGLSLMAKSNIIIDQSARTVGQNDVYMESEEGSINVIHASVHGGRSVGMKAKEDVNIKAVTDHGPAKKSCITAGSGNEDSGLPAIYIDAARDLNVHASDMHSSGKNIFVAGRDINITAHTYNTKKLRTKSSWLGFVKTTTVETTGHVAKSCISGEMNCFKAGGKFTSTAGSFESQLGNIIHAKGKVSMKDIVTKTVTDTNTQVLGGFLYNSDQHSSRESSHGTYMIDSSAAANSCVISEESDIEWIGSSVKTHGNFAEKAARGKIFHSRRILENEQSSVTSGFYASETRKIGYRAQWDNSSYQATSSSSMEVGGSYLAEAKELHMLNDFGVDVEGDMTLDVRKFTFQGAVLKSSSHEHHVDVGLEEKSLQVGYGYSQHESTEHTALQLDVGGTMTFKKVKEGTLDNCTADVGSMKGRVDDMKMITRADTHSHFGVDVSVGVDVTTCIPDHAGFQHGVGSSTKVNQQTAIRVRDGSHGLSVGNLSLEGAAINFDGDVHKFANTIVTEDVNEMDTNFILGIDIGKPKPKQVDAGLSVGLAHSSGRYQSCISSCTGKIDKSISQRVITDQSACRTVDIDINLNANMNVISKTGKQGKRTLNVGGGMTIKGKCGPVSGAMTGHVSTSKTKSNAWKTKSSGGSISASIKHPSKGRELSAGMDIISIKQSSGRQSRSLRGACMMPADGDIIPKVGKKSIGDMVRHVGGTTGREVIRRVKETAAGEVMRKVGEKAAGEVMRNVGEKAGREVMRKVGEKEGCEVMHKVGKKASRDVIRKVGEKAGCEVMRKVGEKAGREVMRKMGGKAVGDVIRKVGDNAVGDVIRKVGENAVVDVIRKVGGKSVGNVIRKVGENAVGDVIRKVGENAVGDVIRKVGENAVGVVIRKVGENAVVT